ncbi:MAG: hypothetical protein HYU36_02805 [Planctomycetes bacterium]|nr:hypothetical protein [Planctomycetota bacterium]
MNTTLRLKIKEIWAGFRNAYTRLPFRYGRVTLTAVPVYHVAITAEDGQGRRATGYAGDCLPPKWFDKSPQKTFRQEIDEMLAAARFAQQKAIEVGSGTPFEIHQAVYPACLEFGDARGLTRLTAGFGSTFIDRALIDAAGRLACAPFHRLARENLLGIDLGWYHSELSGLAPAQVLPEKPLGHLIIRHTVGLLDPLTDEEIPEGERLRDGLPQSLEAVIRFYGVHYFKLKVWGDVEKDAARLAGIVQTIERNVPGPYFCTLDGNENFQDAASFLRLVERLRSEQRFRRFFDSILFIEQPIHRDQALTEASGQIIREMGKVKPVIIDESDQDRRSFPRAIELGYRGVSHKNCKGIYKSLANLGLVQHLNRRGGGYLLSAEDLSTLPVPALQSDLCAVATLGIPHLERNSFHYYRGMAHLSDSDRERMARNHPRLYRMQGREAFLDVQAGQVDIRSLQCQGFGIGFDLDFKSMTPESDWKFESLGL